MRDQAAQAVATGATPDESVAQAPAVAAPAAAEHQSAELLESMGAPTGQPAGGNPAAAQASELAHANEPSGDGSGVAADTPDAPAGTGELYTVVAGDSLWKIARQHYGRGAVWRGIYDANREVIGHNANRIHPGQQLRLPTLDTIIATSDHRPTVEAAFSERWHIEVDRESGAARIPVETFRRMNAQMLLLPPEHVQGTWDRLLHLDNKSGAYMGGGTFGLGERAVGAGDETYGVQGLALTEDAASGATTIKLEATSVIGPGTGLTIDEDTAAEQVAITAVNDARTDFTIDPALTAAHAAGTALTVTNNAPREVPWLEAVVRHEIAHAIDGDVIDTDDFTWGHGRWDSTESFDEWADQMGTPWATNDGTVITPAEQDEIRAVISALRTSPSTAGLDDGLAPEHAIIRYWSKQVPVIEAAKPMALRGEDYWRHSGEYHGTNGLFFTINPYYEKFHCFNEQVQYNQVRPYATYSPAEFFAEVYTVYYEEAGVEGAVPGRLLPVGGWKSWFDANVNNAGAAPTAQDTSGPTQGTGASS